MYCLLALVKTIHFAGELLRGMCFNTQKTQGQQQFPFAVVFPPPPPHLLASYFVIKELFWLFDYEQLILRICDIAHNPTSCCIITLVSNIRFPLCGSTSGETKVPLFAEVHPKSGHNNMIRMPKESFARGFLGHASEPRQVFPGLQRPRPGCPSNGKSWDMQV